MKVMGKTISLKGVFVIFEKKMDKIIPSPTINQDIIEVGIIFEVSTFEVERFINIKRGIRR